MTSAVHRRETLNDFQLLKKILINIWFDLSEYRRMLDHVKFDFLIF